MSITHVTHPGCGSYGCLVRAHVTKGEPPLQFWLAYAQHGGKNATARKARWHNARLLARARRMREGLA